MANVQGKQSRISGTTLLIIICAIIIMAFGVLAFWYVRIYSNDPLVILSKQAPPLSMSIPNVQGTGKVISPDIALYDKKAYGDVVTFHDFNFKLSGKLESQTGYPSSDSMTASYKIEGDESQHQASFTVSPYTENGSLFNDYIETGDTTVFLNLVGDNNFTKYYDSYMTMHIPMGESTSMHKTYILIPKESEDEIIVVQSDDPIRVTGDMSTQIYRKPEDTIYQQRVFSSYEVAAIENTRNSSQSGESQPIEETAPTEDFEQSPSENAAKYNHEQLVAISEHLTRERLKEDGSIAGTTMKLTTTEEADIQSEVDITQGTIPVVNIDGFNIDNVSFQYDAAKSNDVLTFKGLTQNVKNSLDIKNVNSEEAEFILVVKFISNDGRILDFLKFDNLETPLGVDEKKTFDMYLTDVKYAGTLQKLQFQIWR